MEVGLYTNLFIVDADFDKEQSFVISDSSAFPELTEPRASLERARVYADGASIYGCGQDVSDLMAKGFRNTAVKLSEVPVSTSGRTNYS